PSRIGCQSTRAKAASVRRIGFHSVSAVCTHGVQYTRTRRPSRSSSRPSVWSNSASDRTPAWIGVSRAARRRKSTATARIYARTPPRSPAQQNPPVYPKAYQSPTYAVTSAEVSTSSKSGAVHSMRCTPFPGLTTRRVPRHAERPSAMTTLRYTRQGGHCQVINIRRRVAWPCRLCHGEPLVRGRTVEQTTALCFGSRKVSLSYAGDCRADRIFL